MEAVPSRQVSNVEICLKVLKHMFEHVGAKPRVRHRSTITHKMSPLLSKSNTHVHGQT